MGFLVRVGYDSIHVFFLSRRRFFLITINFTKQSKSLWSEIVQWRMGLQLSPRRDLGRDLRGQRSGSLDAIPCLTGYFCYGPWAGLVLTHAPLSFYGRHISNVSGHVSPACVTPDQHLELWKGSLELNWLVV